jgi:hypothetical protein
MKAFSRACVTLVSLALAGCGPRPDASYRYKLTLKIQTPEGIKTGSNVVQLDYYKSWSGDPHRTTAKPWSSTLARAAFLPRYCPRRHF